MAGTPSTDTYNAAGSTDSERKIDVLMGVRETVNGPKLASWPSPKAQEDGRTLEQYEAGRLRGYETRKGKTSGGPSSKQGGLSIAVQLASWPTPVANDDNKTPEAHLAMKRRMGERDGTEANRTAITSLQVMAQTVSSWATPAARDYRSNAASEAHHQARAEQTRGKPLSEQAHQLASGVTLSGSPAETAKPGQLNPAFSLWLMGYPTAWARCAGQVMRSSRRSRRK